MVQNSAPTPAPHACEAGEAADPAPRMVLALWLGLAVMALAGLLVASAWPLGTWRRPGPGGFAVGVLAGLAVIAVWQGAVAVRGWGRLAPAGATGQHREIALLLSGPFLFALAVEPLGAPAAGALAAFGAAIAAGQSPGRAAGIAIVLSLGLCALLTYGLSIPLDWRGRWFS